jgi:hypothetical protein
MGGFLCLLAGLAAAASPITVVSWKRPLPDTTPRPLVVLVLDAETQRPLAGATVFVGSDSVPVLTDSCGWARYSGLADETKRVSVSLPGYLGDFAQPRRDRDTMRASLAIYVDLQRSVGGSVIDGITGAPLAGVAVGISPSDRKVTTDSTGKFYFDSLPPGELRVDLSFSGYHRTSQTLRVAGGEAVRLIMPMYGSSLYGTITGFVTDSGTGEPLEASFVTIEGTDLGNAVDSTGRYTITNLPVGYHSVVASYVGHHDVRKRVLVPYGETARCDFRLPVIELRLDRLPVHEPYRVIENPKLH